MVTLLHLNMLFHGFPIIGDRKDGIGPLESFHYRLLRVEVRRHALHPTRLESFGIGLGRVSGDAADLIFLCCGGVFQDRIDYGAALWRASASDDGHASERPFT